MTDCLDGASAPIRRGAAYGIAAAVKGSGIATLKKYGVVTKLEEARTAQPTSGSPAPESSEDEASSEEEDDVYFGQDARQSFFRLHRDQMDLYEKQKKTNANHIYNRTVETDPRKVYLTKCRELDLLPEPMQLVRKHKSTNMALQHYCIGDKRIEAIAAGLKQMPNEIVRSINMSNNRVSWKGMKALTDAMEDGAPLVELNLNRNLVGPRGGQLLGERMADLNVLCVCQLSHNQLGDMGTEGLCKGLIDNHSIQELYLCGNQIGSYGAEHLAQMIRATRTLTKLDLAWNSIRGAGACAIAQALQSNRSLKHIDFSWNAFGVCDGNKCALAIAQAIKTTQLESVLLSHNKLRGPAVQALVAGMMEASQLCCLHLDVSGTLPCVYTTSGCLFFFLEQRELHRCIGRTGRVARAPKWRSGILAFYTHFQ